jgi:hypothetical protein
MKVAALKYTVLSWVSGLTMLILCLVPYHALLTVWGTSLLGHYTALRLWKEALLFISILGALYLLATDHKIRYHTLSRRLVWLIISYILLNVVWGLLALNQHDVTAKALGYGLISNLRFLAFFLVTWSVALRLGRLRANWQRLAWWPAIGVVVFGLLQALVLPHDVLRHFGYSDATIPAVETINHNHHYVRVMSTLRGANPLGAYLVVPISVVTVLLIRNGRNWRQALFLASALAVLFFSFSRSAWIGAALSIIVLLFLSHLSRRSQAIALITGASLIILGAALTVTFRHNPHFENFVFHTQTHSMVKTSSNQGHLAAFKTGLSNLRHEPLGNGPGTAGPASFYNDHQSRIAENYFLQVGQETGWLGLLLFGLINIGVGALLYIRRQDTLALSLFASLVGLTFISLLSHVWADDTLAYVWWGLAGIAMAPLPEPTPQPAQSETNSQKVKTHAKKPAAKK